MPRTKNDLCTNLSREAILRLGQPYWPKKGGFSTIVYTFDVSIISEATKKYAREHFEQSAFKPINQQTLAFLQPVLQKWEQACENLISFQYIENATPGKFHGVVIANCDNLKEANGYWQPILTRSNTLDYGIVCIPSNYKHADQASIAYNRHTISHEIGHAIGLSHFHDSPSVKAYLQSTPEGLGCSVMPYLRNITTESNHCQTIDTCLNQSYTIFPGPLDGEVCQTIYGEDSPYWDRSLSLTECQAYAAEGVRYGYNLAMRNTGEVFFLRMGDSKCNAKTKMIASYYSLVLVQMLIRNAGGDMSQLAVEATSLLLPLGIELGSLVLSMLSDSLREHGYTRLGQTIDLASGGMAFFALSHNAWRSASRSYQHAWNYGATAVSGILSYTIFSKIGQSMLDSFIPIPRTEGEIEAMAKPPRKSVTGFLSSCYNFFSSTTQNNETLPEAPSTPHIRTSH